MASILSAENKRQLWIPEGFAHGFVVLSDTAEFFYKTTDYYAPEYERCIRWDDNDLSIDWQYDGEPLVSDKDAHGVSFKEADTIRMKILIFGKNGQVGWELNRSLQPLGEIIVLDIEDVDFSQPESLRQVIQNVNPDVICNAVAYTAVDKAEEDEVLAMKINGIAPGVIAEEAKKLDALLIHYSTDYVFDGTKKGPYLETDEPNPINAYGRTKLAGEVAVKSSGCNYLILRTSWVYTSRANNFMLTMLKLAQEREELSIVSDQVGAPTSARLIADITLVMYSTSNKRNSRWYIFIRPVSPDSIRSYQLAWFYRKNCRIRKK